MNSHDDNDGSISVALAELADTMPEDPNRVEGIHARARRLRTRRRAGRTAAGLAVAGATIAAIIAVRPGPAAVSIIPASAPTVAPISLPECSSLTPPDTAPDTGPASPPDAADTAKAAAAAAAPSATGRETPVNGVDGIKGLGTVAAATDASITVTLEEPIPGWPADVTGAFTEKTSFYDGDAEVTDRPIVNAGDQVAFASVADGNGGYNLIMLQVHLPATDAEKPTSGEITDAKKAAAAAADDSATTADDSGYVKGTAEIASVQPGSLTLKLREGQLAGHTVTAALAPDIVYSAGDQKCVDPAFTAGQVVGVLLVHGDGDTYTVQQVALFRQ
jgi:hypothetical protein